MSDVWYIEVQHPGDDCVFALVQHQDNPRASSLMLTVPEDQEGGDRVASRLVGHIFAPPIEALRLLRRAGMVLRRDATAISSSSPSDKARYYEAKVTAAAEQPE